MSQSYDLNTKRKQVRYLIETVPGLLDHPILALLLYWKVFDGCDIPKSTFDSIIAKGTPPDSLTRLVRFALADIQEDKRRAVIARLVNEGEKLHEADKERDLDNGEAHSTAEG